MIIIHNNWKPFGKAVTLLLGVPWRRLEHRSSHHYLWSRVCTEETETSVLCSDAGSWFFVLFLVVSSYSLKPTGDKKSSDFLSSGHPEETFAIVLEFLLVQTSNKSLQQGPSPTTRHSALQPGPSPPHSILTDADT